jgi:hypothetical protein
VVADNNRLNSKKRENNQVKIMVILLFIVLFLLILFRTCAKNELFKNESVQESGIDTLSKVKDTVVPDVEIVDSTDTIQGDSVKNDTISMPDRLREKKKAVTVPVPTAAVSVTSDTVSTSSRSEDTTSGVTVGSIIDTSECARDTTGLWVYPDPSGGLHRGAVTVRFYSNRFCVIYYRMKDSDEWVEYHNGEIQIEKTGTLVFFASDTCGRKMASREEYYEIDNVLQSMCSPDMGYVKVGDASFCIDTYEWPNKKGSRPTAYVSLYQAGDSCFSVGKRLCTYDEWMIACSGPYSNRYPYGDTYEENACVTADTSVRISGGKPECRSFFGMYDMSGNLLEWTDTRSVENSRFYYVSGGFWDSGVKSSCSEKRYSYFTQNQHNPVGFRCCKDVSDK